MVRFRRRIWLAAVMACLAASAAASAAEPQGSPGTAQEDTLNILLSDVIAVSGARLQRDSVAFPFEKTRFSDLLHTNGFALIQKGVYFAQDIYADGFKRDDIAIIIDGERYHNACPNRMDNPLARANPLEMQSISLERTSAAEKPGLGGTVAYRRGIPGTDSHLRAGVSTSAGAAPARDVAVAAVTKRHQFSAYYAEGSDYTDGDGRDFTDNYGYKKDPTYRVGQAALSGLRGDWQYRAEIMYTQDVMFPYLMMDERDVRVLNASVGWRRHRLYVTHTDHLMDNGLRQATGLMETDARNLTVGLTGPSYELVVRRWDADNRMIMPMATISNHMIPDLRVISGAVWKRRSTERYTAWGRLGLSNSRLGDKSQADLYEPLFGATDESRWFPTLGAGASVRYAMTSSVSGSATADVVSEPPTPEQLYIAYRAPMNNPWWSGNPELSAPVRASLRTQATGYGVTLDLSASHVWNYVEQIRASSGTKTYRTYQNVDAVLLSAGLSGSWKYFDFNAAYTHATNTGSDSALVEIAPLALVSRLKIPVGRTSLAFLRHTYNDAQTRIDRSLGETPTPAWHRFDIGAQIKVSPVMINLEIRNLADELYYQHLSYARNPYASGSRVFEPGRTVALSVAIDGV